ncbi:MAG: gephyrin-like molybdotransferase Glp [Alphaproteobacteria bacterium]
MTQLSDDCFAAGGRLMTTAEALELLAATVVPVTDTERVPLRRAAGRILAEDVVADRDVPPHDNSAVDGYAVFFDDLHPDRETRLRVKGRIAAGRPLTRPARRGEALRIFTGAPMPKGPDTVMMQEDCRLEGDTVVIAPGIRRGANRREAGEDVKAGTTILRAGYRLRPQEVGLAASIGRTSLTMYRPLAVAIISTGDEVHEPGSELPPGAIYDANRYVLFGLLEGLGSAVTDLGILPDDRVRIRDALETAAKDHDLLLTSGGVSVGEEDQVKAAVEELGKIHLWQLAIKPGRPIALGQVGRVPFVGLPGNPVAVMVTFLRLVRPLVLRLSGCSQVTPILYRVPADFEHKKKRNRREWVRARLVARPDGGVAAEKFARQGAGILSSMVASDGLVELPEDMTHLKPGTLVDFLPFSEVDS